MPKVPPLPSGPTPSLSTQKNQKLVEEKSGPERGKQPKSEGTSADSFSQTKKGLTDLKAESAASTHLRADRNPDVVVVTSNDDDPFARPNNLEKMPQGDFSLDAHGRPIGLVGPRVKILDDETIFRANPDGTWVSFANNPWAAAKPSKNGNFTFPSETRFPIHGVVRDASGKAVLDAKGLQQWNKRDLFASQTIAFEAANATSHAAEAWAGRPLKWGTAGQIPINTHAFVGFNAFFSPADRALFFGVVPYRLPGETDIKIFEMASSWEVAAHEAGHGLHNELKPNRGLIDEGYRQWGESFGDQMAMWTSLKDPDRVKELLTQTRGDLNKANEVSAIGEVYASLVGEGTGLRDSFQNKTVASTSDEFHDRSEVLTGACYKIFARIAKEMIAAGKKPKEAVTEAANIMGTFLVRTADFTPENTMTLEDVCKGYLKVDAEYFGGKYQQLLSDEFTRRGMFRGPPNPGEPGVSSLDEWKAHEAAVPALSIGTKKDAATMTKLVADNLEKLGIGSHFGLNVQSQTVDKQGHHIVRLELTRGRGTDAEAIANNGVMVFRPDGTLADYQTTMPNGLTEQKAIELLDQAHQAGLHEHGKLGFVKDDAGEWTVQVVVPKDEGAKLGHYLEVRDLKHPNGYRTEYAYNDREHMEQKLKGLLPSGAQVLSPEEL